MASVAILSEPHKLLKHLRRLGVDMDRVADLAGPGQVQTAIEIVKGWQGLKHKTPGGRKKVLADALDKGGVEDDDRRVAVWEAAKYIEKVLVANKI